MDLRRKYKGRDTQANPAQLPTAGQDRRILPNKEGGYAPNFTPMAMTETENEFIVGADVLVGKNDVDADNPANREDLTQAVPE